MITDKIIEEYRRLQSQSAEIQKQLSKLPDGTLTCARGNHCFKWYHSDGHTRVYIPKKNRALAEKLAIKKYLTLTLKDLQNEQTAIESYLRHHSSSSNQAETLLTAHPGYQELLAPYFKPAVEEILQWTNTPYERNPSHPENLIHKTSSGIFVRSKSEAMIALFLHTNHIPFRYECALNLGGITLYPDFTILHPQTKKLYYWEHFGLMDDTSYIQTTYAKLQLYATHKIIPTIQLITTYETKDNPLSYDDIIQLGNHYFL